MGEQTDTTNVTEESNTLDAGKTFTQEELDRIVQERIARERNKFADYDDLKSRASKLDELEEANKSEVERAKDAQQKAEADLVTMQLEATRLRVANKYGIGDEYLELLVGADEEELESKATKIAALVSAESSGPSFPKVDPSQGGMGGSNSNMSVADRFAQHISERFNT